MRFLLVLLLAGMVHLLQAQEKVPALDLSPLDVSYYPPNFPVLKLQNKNDVPLTARILYSRPALKGRAIFGQLVEYGKVWRTGANESTEIEFFRDVLLSGTRIKKGRYSLFSIPDTSAWTLILNRETDCWGAFLYDARKDVARIRIIPERITDTCEYMTMYFDRNTRGGFDLIIQWEQVRLTLPFSLPAKSR